MARGRSYSPGCNARGTSKLEAVRTYTAATSRVQWPRNAEVGEAKQRRNSKLLRIQPVEEMSGEALD